MAERALENDEMLNGASVTSNKTLASRQSAGSLAHEKCFMDERAQFNDMLAQVKDQHSQELEKARLDMEAL
jgi:hypothetical protein